MEARAGDSLVSGNPRKTVLVVDDHPGVVDAVKGILEAEGYAVWHAYGGRELLSILERRKPYLVILDIMLPDMDGLEILSRLREPQGVSPIPVILLTAKTQYEDILRGYRIGADYYITKPFTRAQLLDGVNTLLGGPF